MPPSAPYLVRCNGVPIWCASTNNVGWSIDRGGSTNPSRQVDGSMLGTAQYLKRGVDCKTIPYASEDAYSLIQLVEGKGVLLPFDVATLPSSKATFPSGAATWVAGYSGSGPVAGACKFGAGSVSMSALQSLTYANLLGVINSAMGITINLWAKQPSGACQFAAVTPCDIVIGCGSSPAAGLNLSYATNSISSSAITWLANWNMITAVVRKPTAAYPTMVLYFNGANVGSGGPVEGSYLGSLVSSIVLGGAGACSLDDASVMPFALNDTMVASIYQQQQQMGGIPEIYVDGDGVREAITATGKISNSTYTLTRDALGDFVTTGRMLEFLLQEV